MKVIGIKQGVLAGLPGVVRPETWFAIGVIAQIFDEHDCALTITSLTEGVHPAGPEHAEGRAVDIRTRDIEPRKVKDLALEMKKALDPLGFDVVIESNHFHCEFDPKVGEQCFKKGVA